MLMLWRGSGLADLKCMAVVTVHRSGGDSQIKDFIPVFSSWNSITSPPSGFRVAIHGHQGILHQV